MEKLKQEYYYQTVRYDLLNLIPGRKENKVLEIGAGEGNTLIAAKEMGIASEICGIELVKIENSNQSNLLIDKFEICDVEKDSISFNENYFDVILAGDVLEHLHDPWASVGKLSKYLKTGGVFIASIPTVRSFTALKEIVFRGDFKYQHSGIFDKTHLRFFCRKNMINLFENNGLKVIKIVSNVDMFNPLAKKRILNSLTFGFIEEFIVKKYNIVAEK